MFIFIQCTHFKDLFYFRVLIIEVKLILKRENTYIITPNNILIFNEIMYFDYMMGNSMFYLEIVLILKLW